MVIINLFVVNKKSINLKKILISNFDKNNIKYHNIK